MLLDSIVGPLFEFNPLKYARSEAYRASCAQKFGKRAKRIFYYQLFWLLLFMPAIIAGVIYLTT